MATHSSVLAWRIPGMVELGGLPSIGSHRVRHNWGYLAEAAASAYLRLLIFLPAILIPAFDSSSLAFHIMYSACKLNKQGEICSLDVLLSLFELVHCSLSCSNYCFLTCIQVSQGASKVVWYYHLFKNFPQFVVIHTIKGFTIVNEGEVDIFLVFFCFFYDSTDVSNLISGSSAFSKSSLYIWKILVPMPLKPILNDFELYLVSMRNKHNWKIIWRFFGIDFLWEWNETWPFPIL